MRYGPVFGVLLLQYIFITDYYYIYCKLFVKRERKNDYADTICTQNTIQSACI